MRLFLSKFKEIKKNLAVLLFTAVLVPFLTQSCIRNPVTGENQFHLIQPEMDVEIGTKSYIPLQQSQGGPYLTHPAINDYVTRVGQQLADASDCPELPYEFVILNQSIPNAWTLPGGKIAINRGLLAELENEAELAAVLSHEIVHAAARHGAQSLERGILLQTVLQGVDIALEKYTCQAIAMSAAALGAELISMKYSRAAEFEADYYGIHYMFRVGYDVRAAIALQEIFLRLANECHPSWLAGLFASHPPSCERIEANKITASELAPGGFIGFEEYQYIMAPLKISKEAYAMADEGLLLLENGKSTSQAALLAEKAIKMVPNESMFYGLLGKARFQQQLYKDACIAFTEAIRLNNSYFEFYLMRGLAFDQLGQVEESRRDLEKSLEYLETAEAHNALAQLYLKEGRTSEAIEHLRIISNSNTSLSAQAQCLLAGLELPACPEKYICFETKIDEQGFVIVTAINKSVIPVFDLNVTVHYRGVNGVFSPVATLSYPGIIPPSTPLLFRTTFRPCDSKISFEHRLRFEITAVKISE
jgi:beta-barrel assembly-enhancing protease